MKTKDGVELSDLKLEMRPALVVVGHVYSDMGFDAVVTCTGEDEHGDGSLHPFGYAFDCGIKGMSDAELNEAVSRIQIMLGQDYQVIKESDHIHLEYQPRFWMDSKAIIAISLKLI